MATLDDTAMRLDDSAIRVMRALENHPVLDVLQIATSAELPPSVALGALRGLAGAGVVDIVDENAGVFSLNTQALSDLLETA
jgi:DNA-binding IscR family transcriptional regulator